MKVFVKKRIYVSSDYCYRYSFYFADCINDMRSLDDYQVIHYNMIKDELPYFDQQTKKFLLDTIKKKVETQYGYSMKTGFYAEAFCIEDKLFYRFNRLTYTSFLIS